MENNVGPLRACGCKPKPKIPSDGTKSSKMEKMPDSSKYFQEVGAEMIGNQLIIRVEKDRNRVIKKRTGQWDPPCDCAIPEIRRPSTTQGPRIVNAGDNNQILFRIRSRTLVSKDDPNYRPEAFAYQVGKKSKDPNDPHRTVMVHPHLGDPSQSQEVHSDHISDGNHNIYLLRIKKPGDQVKQKNRNIELELRTPRPPTPRPVSSMTIRRSQPKKPQKPPEKPPQPLFQPSMPEPPREIEQIPEPKRAVKSAKSKKKKKK